MISRADEKRPIRIGCLSDTHLADPEECRRLARELLTREFQGVDLVLHAGDVGNPELLVQFAPIETLAVAGNTDQSHADLPSERLVSCNGVRIALAHGWGAGTRVAGSLLKYFSGSAPDVIVYGHSHVPDNRLVNGTLLFNPGSPTRPRSDFGPSVGVLEIHHGQVSGRVIPWSA
ncbi:MAG: metallophosphoesterase [Deltaproteobacteria bacterium]|nr:MAG: metallophosphoesterase [Deltaproteobacteria bacterium]